MTIAYKTLGTGASLAAGTDGTTFTLFVAPLVEFTDGDTTSPSVDTTGLADTIGNSQAGTAQPGEFVAKCFWTAANYTTLSGWQSNGTSVYWKAQVLDGTSTHSSDVQVGYIIKLSKWGDLKNSEKVITTITIKKSGAETFTAGS